MPGSDEVATTGGEGWAGTSVRQSIARCAGLVGIGYPRIGDGGVTDGPSNAASTGRAACAATAPGSLYASSTTAAHTAASYDNAAVTTASRRTYATAFRCLFAGTAASTTTDDRDRQDEDTAESIHERPPNRDCFPFYMRSQDPSVTALADTKVLPASSKRWTSFLTIMCSGAAGSISRTTTLVSSR
jgi:hypothetical protein